MKPKNLKRSAELLLILLIIIAANWQCDKNTNKPDPNTEPFTIENLSVTFGKWDRVTNRAGDFYFTHDFQKIFNEFGAQVLDYNGNIKELPTMDFLIKLDASVFAISEGEVTRIEYQEGSKDYEFSIQSLNDPLFTVIYDHLVNLKITVGNQVQPGDTLGNPRPLNAEIGMLEIMINNSDTKRSYCPFNFFNEEKLEQYQQKVYQLIKDWEDFKGDTTIYDEENHFIPGCRYESMLTY